MKSIKLIKKQAMKAAQLSFKAGKLDEVVVRKFIKGFKALPLGESVLTLNYFMKALRSEISKTTLTIESVVKIPKADITELQGIFGKQYKVLETREELDSSLLGGIKVRIGDVIFDNSTRSKINQIKETLVS